MKEQKKTLFPLFLWNNRVSRRIGRCTTQRQNEALRIKPVMDQRHELLEAAERPALGHPATEMHRYL